MNWRPVVATVAFAFVAFTLQVMLTNEPESDPLTAVRNAVDALTITVMVAGGFVVFALYRK